MIADARKVFLQTLFKEKFPSSVFHMTTTLTKKIMMVYFFQMVGNPVVYKQLVDSVKKLLQKQVPTLGICMGHQILSLAAGAKTYKLKYGHRSQNQPVKQVDSNKCYITSQNHSFAVSAKSLPRGWQPWFENLNDYSNEGVRHEKLPFRSVQFHPEAMPGPVDSSLIFDEFLKDVK